MRADLNLDLCLVKNDCVLRLNVKRNGLFYCLGLLLASLSTASNYSVKNSRLKAVYRCDSTADEAELSLVSGPRRQKLLPSADRDILRASEYICNLKSAGTKSLSPLVVDFRWADEPQIWGPPHAEGVQPCQRWIADKNLWRGRADCPAWTEAEHLTPRGDLGISKSQAARFTLLHGFVLLRCKDELWQGIKQYLDAVNCPLYDATYIRGDDNLMSQWCLSKCLAIVVGWKKVFFFLFSIKIYSWL